MSKRERVKTIFLYAVFICYIVFLLKLLFLSRISLVEIFDSHRTSNRSINLIPFHSIKEFLLGDSAKIQRFAWSNVVGNILIFIPLGTYLSLFKKEKRIIPNLLFIICLASLSVEVIQGLLGIGASDIDDIILNSLGGWMGIVGYKLIALIVRDERKASTVIASISAMGLPVIFYLLFMVRLRLGL
ncbi:VanZ like family protein [compost metagenome]